jgi:hypothetical protein
MSSQESGYSLLTGRSKFALSEYLRTLFYQSLNKMGDEKRMTARLPLPYWDAARIRETVPKSLPGEDGACPSYGLKLSLRKFGRIANIAVPKLRRTPALSGKLSGPTNGWPVLVL